jgi:hypothetical protein
MLVKWLMEKFKQMKLEIIMSNLIYYISILG